MLMLIIILLLFLLCIMSYFSHKKQAIKLVEFVPFKAYGLPKNPPVIIIPGLDGCSAFFADIVPNLTVYFHVIVFNLPLLNHQYHSGNENYSFKYIAKCLNDVMDDLKIDKAVLIGESFGGIVAQRFVIDYPHRAEKLVLLSSLARTELSFRVKMKVKFLLPIVKAIGFIFPTFAQYLFAVFHQYDVVEAHEKQWVKDLFVSEASKAHFASIMKRVEIASIMDMSNEVNGIVHQTLIIYGDSDRFTKTLSFELKTYLQNSQLFSIPGGHLAHVSCPQFFSNTVVDFISQ